jgi:hypothetical protein
VVQASSISRAPLAVTMGTRSSAVTSDLSHVGATPNAFTSTDARAQGRYSLPALEDTLDWMYENKEPFMGGYELCSGLERLEGGQGLVQFCHRTYRKDEFAIKCASFTPEAVVTSVMADPQSALQKGADFLAWQHVEITGTRRLANY